MYVLRNLCYLHCDESDLPVTCILQHMHNALFVAVTFGEAVLTESLLTLPDPSISVEATVEVQHFTVFMF